MDYAISMTLLFAPLIFIVAAICAVILLMYPLVRNVDLMNMCK